MKGKYVICRHFKSIKELEKAENYLNKIEVPYEVNQLKNGTFSIHVCFDGFKNPLEAQINFQNYIFKNES